MFHHRLFPACIIYSKTCRTFCKTLFINAAHISKQSFNVLGIETSCDDTAVGIVNSDRKILSEAIHHQHEIHEPSGGIVPNLAMVNHQTYLPSVICEALNNAALDMAKDIDVVAVTRGPGLPGCLGIGLSAAKTLAAEAHALTARLTQSPELLPFPFLTLLISGGHTLILVAHGIGHYTQLGTTIDDSIGDAFDKTARLLKLSWLKGRGGGAGAALEQCALKGDPEKYIVPIPMRKDARRKREMNYSFSAATFQRAATIHLIDKLELAFEWCRNKGISLTALVASGGHNIPLICPPPHLCTDNGIMIAWTGVERFRAGLIDKYTIDHIPKWSIANKSFNIKFEVFEISHYTSNLDQFK
ncbi:38024_t:CDS:2 [Gigaspora margarita]|uniref:N(6)-L-threonylcarbamoyladenine synthase n=1 Tax=Gigaspora margarita TaxID=4874 RepID=A0ABN7UBH5_GIGMA|nr:38024_t:CDS:2 [Gigaspora margarita]